MMKKVCRMLGAAALALLLAVLPLGVLAEDMALVTLSLADPVVTMNGMTFLDMTGLKINLVSGMTEAGDKGTLQLQVTGGDETALAALVELSDGKLVLAADGMNNTYSLSVDELIQGMDFSGVQNYAALLESIEALGDSDIAERYAETVADFGQELAAGAEEKGKTTYTMLSGDMEMTQYDFSVSAESADKLCEDMFGMLDEIPEVAEFKAALTAMAGEDVFDGKSLLELYRESGLSQMVEGSIYSTEDGSCSAVEMRQKISMASEDEEIELRWRLLLETAEDGSGSLYIDVDGFEDGEAQVGIYAAVMSAADGSESIDFGAGNYEDGEFVPEMQMTLIPSMTTINGVEAEQYTLTITVDGETATFVIEGYEQDGAMYGRLGLSFDEGSADVVFAGNAADDGSMTGTLSFGLNDGSTEYGLKIDVQTNMSMMDSAEVLVGADGAVDIASMNANDLQQVSSEATAMFLNGLSVLDRNIVGLKGMMSSLFTNTGM